MRQFHLVFTELTCRTVNIAEAEEIEYWERQALWGDLKQDNNTKDKTNKMKNK